MKKIYLATFLCTVALSLSACGFEPVYKANSLSDSGQESVISALEQVEIGNIPDHSGQFLRNALIDRFYRNGRPENPRYQLTVAKISEATTDLDITKTSDATRGQLKLSTVMSLNDKQTGKTLLTRKLTSISSYNILGSEFTNQVTEENTRQNALNDLARQIELQIGLYLRRQ